MYACSGGDFVGVDAFRGQKCWIPWSWSYGGWSCLKWALRPELRSSARAVCTLNHSGSTLTFDGLLTALLCHQSPRTSWICSGPCSPAVYIILFLHHSASWTRLIQNHLLGLVTHRGSGVGVLRVQFLPSSQAVQRWTRIQSAHSETTDKA